MVKAQIIVVDPSALGQASVAGVLRYRRWTAKSLDIAEVRDFDGPADVVVGVEDRAGNGCHALREFRRVRPSAARILICDPRAAAQVVARGEPAHQVVVRPATGEKVIGAVKRALRVRELLNSPAVAQVAASFDGVPSMPETWMRLSELMESTHSSLQDAAALVQRDVGLASKVLQLVNSGLYGFDRPASSLFAAVQRLGLRSLRDLVLSVEVFEELASDHLLNEESNLPLPLYSHLSAMAARIVSPIANAEAAFSAGLFHELGHLALLAKASVRYQDVIDRPAGQSRHAAEISVFGIDSRALGAWLLATWGLPHDVVEAVQWCNRPEQATGRGAPLALSVWLGAQLVVEAASALQGSPADRVSPSQLAPWGLSDRLEGWRTDVNELVERSTTLPAVG